MEVYCSNLPLVTESVVLGNHSNILASLLCSCGPVSERRECEITALDRYRSFKLNDFYKQVMIVIIRLYLRPNFILQKLSPGYGAERKGEFETRK
jgi:hypothetical protein